MSRQQSRKKSKKNKRLRIISNILKNNFPKLQYISEKTDAALRSRLLKKHSRKSDFCKAVKELANNCVRGNMKLNRKFKKALQKEANIIRELAATRNRNRQKQLVLQSGGILPFLIPAATAALGGILQNVLF